MKLMFAQKLILSSIFYLIFLFSSVSVSQAATLRVPGQYGSIQEAYNQASDGDEILVAKGAYSVCLYSKKRIILRAEHPAALSSAGQHSILNASCEKPISFDTPLGNLFNPAERWEFVGFVLNNGVDGVSYENGGSGIVRHNIISGQNDDPIDIDNASEALIEGNILDTQNSGGGDGIENRLHGFSSSRDILMIFRNNIILNSRQDGIQLIDQTGGLTKRKYLIANNLIIGNRQAGIGTTQGGNSTQGTSGYALPEKIYVLNNTFINNGWGGIIGGANMTVHNNIFYNNGAALRNVSGSSSASRNLFFGNVNEGSNIQNPNITADPQFTAAGTPNFSSYQLNSNSPAIDAGKNVDSYYTEFGLTPPGYSGSAPDIGWSESGFTNPSPSPASCPADVNNDKTVNVTDIITVLQAWGSCSDCKEDIDGNNTVNVADIILVLQAWGDCP